MKYHVVTKIDTPEALEEMLNKMAEEKGTYVSVIVVENCTYTLIYTTE